MGNPAALAVLSGLLEMPGEQAETRALLRQVVERLDRIEAKLPPLAGDFNRWHEITGGSRATFNRRIADGSLKRIDGGKGKRALVDLSSLTPTSDAEVAKLAHEARSR